MDEGWFAEMVGHAMEMNEDAFVKRIHVGRIEGGLSGRAHH